MKILEKSIFLNNLNLHCQPSPQNECRQCRFLKARDMKPLHSSLGSVQVLCCDKVWLGLGTNTTWLGVGKHISAKSSLSLHMFV